MRLGVLGEEEDAARAAVEAMHDEQIATGVAGGIGLCGRVVHSLTGPSYGDLAGWLGDGQDAIVLVDDWQAHGRSSMPAFIETFRRVGASNWIHPQSSRKVS